MPKTLQRLIDCADVSPREKLRARAVLDRLSGLTAMYVATIHRVNQQSVKRWLKLFRELGTVGLLNRPRKRYDRKGTYSLRTKPTQARIHALIATPPPPGQAKWTRTLISQELALSYNAVTKAVLKMPILIDSQRVRRENAHLQVAELLANTPPKGHAVWTRALIAKELEIPYLTVCRALDSAGIKLKKMSGYKVISGDEPSDPLANGASKC